MRALNVASGVVVAVAGAAIALPAAAQTGQPNAFDYVCKLTPEACIDGNAPSDAKERTDNRGFSLALAAQPKARPAPAARTSYNVPARIVATPARPAPAPGLKPRSLGVSTGDMMINFLNGSAELTPGARTNALMIAKAMNMVPPTKRFVIEGHTSAVGTPETNRVLSEQRATALIDFLVSNGVDRSRLEAKGYGFDRPLPGRAPASPQNRRVEAKAIS